MAKHIDIIHHFSTEQGQLGHIAFKNVPSACSGYSHQGSMQAALGARSNDIGSTSTEVDKEGEGG